MTPKQDFTTSNLQNKKFLTIRVTGMIILEKVRCGRIRNENITDITAWIIGRLRIWNEHILRMDGNRLVEVARDNMKGKLEDDVRRDDVEIYR